MRAADLSTMSSIDDSIQELLGDLQHLYAERLKITTKSKPTAKPRKAKSIKNISLTDIDMTLTDPVQPKRFNLFR